MQDIRQPSLSIRIHSRKDLSDPIGESAERSSVLDGFETTDLYPGQLEAGYDRGPARIAEIHGVC